MFPEQQSLGPDRVEFLFLHTFVAEGKIYSSFLTTQVNLRNHVNKIWWEGAVVIKQNNKVGGS